MPCQSKESKDRHPLICRAGGTQQCPGVRALYRLKKNGGEGVRRIPSLARPNASLNYLI